jgi:hypothetical protein
MSQNKLAIAQFSLKIKFQTKTTNPYIYMQEVHYGDGTKGLGPTNMKLLP